MVLNTFEWLPDRGKEWEGRKKEVWLLTEGNCRYAAVRGGRLLLVPCADEGSLASCLDVVIEVYSDPIHKRQVPILPVG